MNTPNMSYCKFENTLSALRQCYADMSAESDREKQARDSLLTLIYEINEEFGADEDGDDHDFSDLDGDDEDSDDDYDDDDF